MADDLGAVLEAPEAVADGAVEQESAVATEVEQQETPVDGVEEPKGDERVLKQWMRDIKATNPEAFKELKGIVFGKKTLDDKLKDFDLDGTKSFLEERGGREAILESLTTLEGKAAEYDGWLQKIEAGDSSVLSDIPPESLAKLAPAVMQNWQQSDPEAWSSEMSGVIAATIQQNGIPLFLERMEMMLKYNETEALTKSIQDLKGWAASFATKAAAPRTAPARTAQPGKTDDVKSERDQWEAEKFTTSLKSEVDGFRTPLIDAQLKPFYARRAGDNDAQQLAKSTVVNQVIDRMAEDKDFQKSLNGLVARKDKEGAMRLIKSRETAAINEIAPKVGRMIFGNPAPTTKPVLPKVDDPKALRRPAEKAPQDPKDAILQRIFAR